jgi:cytochrome c oxidase cbb3-type subunit 3
MKKLIIYGISIGIVLMGVTLFYTADIIGDSYINIATLIFATLIIIVTVATTLKYINHIKNDKSEGELAPFSWDGIKEFTNNAPRGWMIFFLLSMIYAMVYIFYLYPLNSFSQIGQYNEEVLEYNKKFEKKWANIKNDKQALNNMGESIFVVQCAVCHGVLADGLNGKARNLMSWGSPEHIEEVILKGSSGSMGFMPPGMASGNTAKAISHYVSKEFFDNKNVDEALIEQGKAGYAVCAGCHGVNGNGIANVAPSLKAMVTATLNTGRKGKIGMMPAFKQFNNIEKKALNTYIYNLKN